MNPIPIIKPTSVTLITTNQCTAACRNCCMNCNPEGSSRMSLEQMKQYVDNAIQSFPDICQVILTGGESFLLGEDLRKIIQYINSKNLISRVVSNGYWATSIDIAKKILAELKEIGLTEINFSTGDDHQEFVPIEKVINGVIASIDLHLNTVVNIESGPGRLFSTKDFYHLEPLCTYLKENNENSKYLHVLSGMWMPFTQESMKDLKPFSSEFEKKIVTNRCTNLFSSVTISPNNRLLACCGLPTANIKYLDIGNLANHNIKELYENQFSDFLKIWLYVDGPFKILQYIASKEGEDFVPELAYHSHTCFYCAVLFTNKKYLSYIQNHYKEKYSSVMMHYLVLTQRAKKL